MNELDEYPDTSMFETSGVDESEYCFEHNAILDECEQCGCRTYTLLDCSWIKIRLTLHEEWCDFD